jgi:hypothetical protein
MAAVKSAEAIEIHDRFAREADCVRIQPSAPGVSR